ncbi:unnamed protein product, partial [Porites lobata]
MGSGLLADWAPTCVLHSSLFKMADKSGGDQSPEKIESLQEQSGDRGPPDPQINGTTEEEPARGVQPPASGSSKKKKKKKKGKVDEGSSEVLSSESLTSSVAMNLQNLRQLQNLQKSFELLRAGEVKAPKTTEEALRKKYQFWDTQPVPKLDEEVSECGCIEENKPIEELRSDPYTLPQGFVWDTLDISNEKVLKELYTLLNENYVEDDDNMFRFDYSPEFLLWALKPPGWKSEWHCGVRVASNKKLVGFISAIPAHIRVYKQTVLMVEINFLCVHKKLRSKRVAPVLIREITRRVNLQGIFQAVYTAGVVLPKPVACCRYWHRSLNPKKLVEVKFSHLSRNMTMQRTVKLYRLPEKTKTERIYPLTTEDMTAAFEKITEYLKKFNLAPVFSEEDFIHWFTPREGIVDSFVVKDEEGKVTDMISFYTLPSTVMHHPTHKQLKAAYSFYNVSEKTPLVDLMQDALILAKQRGFDVFNALDLMDNKDFLEKLKFGIGDGNLQYYLYNWKCPGMTPEQVRY